jgi:hypothetical protein
MKVYGDEGHFNRPYQRGTQIEREQCGEPAFGGSEASVRKSCDPAAKSSRASRAASAFTAA